MQKSRSWLIDGIKEYEELLDEKTEVYRNIEEEKYFLVGTTYSELKRYFESELKSQTDMELKKFLRKKMKQIQKRNSRNYC
jgi:hypothetical protein